MTDPLSKQSANNVQNLPLLCVESICKFTPTSNLTRLYSNDVPLPGAFWQFGLETVLRKRLPLSLGDDLLLDRDAPLQLRDVSGATIAIMKQPEAFRFSPLRELIDRAALTLAVHRIRASPADCSVRISVVHGEAILAHLPKVTELAFIHDTWKSDPTVPKDNDLLEFQLKRLLPKLHTLRIHFSSALFCEDTRHLDLALTRYICDLALPQMVSLRRLDLPENIFGNMLLRAHAVNFTFNHSARRVLSGLTCLRVVTEWSFCNGYPNHGHRSYFLPFLSPLFSNVSTLVMKVEGAFNLYLVAFRQLTHLSSLGLVVWDDDDVDLNGVTFGESEAVASVLDLRVHCWRVKRRKVCAIASLFPRVKALAFQVADGYGETLMLAAECCAKRVLPALDKLSCFYPHGYYNQGSEHFRAFIGSSNLPEAVDLSQLIFLALAQERDLFADIYLAMQINSTKSLIMRGPVDRQALSILQRRVEMNGEKVSVTSWKDRDLGEQPSHWFISQQTDFKIVGVKTGGSLQGQPFTIRVVHQLTKQRGIFDYVEEKS